MRPAKITACPTVIGAVQAVSAVGLSDRQTVFIQGGYIFIEGMVLRQIGELAGIGFAADKIVRAVLLPPERERSSETAPAAGTAIRFFMECHSFPESQDGKMQILRGPILHIGVEIGIHQRQSFVRDPDKYREISTH